MVYVGQLNIMNQPKIEFRQLEYQNRKVPDQFDIYYNNEPIGTYERNRDQGKQNIISGTVRSPFGGIAIVPDEQRAIEWLSREYQRYHDTNNSSITK